MKPNILKKIINWVVNRFDLNNEKCFKKIGKDGYCYGILGGDSYTDNVSYHCVSCKHWKCYIGKGKQ